MDLTERGAPKQATFLFRQEKQASVVSLGRLHDLDTSPNESQTVVNSNAPKVCLLPQCKIEHL